jgi:hypothetical protein
LLKPTLLGEKTATGAATLIAGLTAMTVAASVTVMVSESNRSGKVGVSVTVIVSLSVTETGAGGTAGVTVSVAVSVVPS